MKAAVLPVPVWAAARTSRPARTSGMAAAWTGVGAGVALLRDGPEEIGRQAERVEGQAWLLRGFPLPSRRGSAGATSARRRARVGARPDGGRPEHSRNRPDRPLRIGSTRLAPSPRAVRRSTGRGGTESAPISRTGAISAEVAETRSVRAGILGRRPPGHPARQTGINRRTPPPRQDLVHTFVGCFFRSTTAVPIRSDRDREPASPGSRGARHSDPSCPCLPAAPAPSTRPMRAVPEERRQGSCRSPAAAPSGRHPSDRA